MKLQPYSYRSNPSIPPFPDDKAIFLYDGYCRLCSGWVQMLLRHDRKAKFRLLPAQSPLGESLYRHYGLDPEAHSSNMVLVNGLPLFRSQSSIYVVSGLGFPWVVVRLLYLVPPALLDRAYAWVARNRLRWFGRRDTCMMSVAGYENRFITGATAAVAAPCSETDVTPIIP